MKILNVFLYWLSLPCPSVHIYVHTNNIHVTNDKGKKSFPTIATLIAVDDSGVLRTLSGFIVCVKAGHGVACLYLASLLNNSFPHLAQT